MAKKIFEPDNPKPFKVSRSKIENFIRCKACFWMDIGQWEEYRSALEQLS